MKEAAPRTRTAVITSEGVGRKRNFKGISMKVIGISNFDKDDVSDILVREDVDQEMADDICAAENTKYGGEYSTYFYKVVPDDYELYVWGP